MRLCKSVCLSVCPYCKGLSDTDGGDVVHGGPPDVSLHVIGLHVYYGEQYDGRQCELCGLWLLLYDASHRCIL